MSKDKYSVHWDGTEGSHDSSQPVAVSSEKEHGLPDHTLDRHHTTLMDAHAIKQNPHIMKHLKPHLEKKAADMKILMSETVAGNPDVSPEHKTPEGKIKSLAGLKQASKKIS